MVNRSLKTFLIIIFVFQIILCRAQSKEIVAYYGGGGDMYRGFYVKNLKTSGAAGKITSLMFAFAMPAPDSAGNILPFFTGWADYEVPFTSENSIDGISDDSLQPLKGEFNQLKKLKAEFPQMKILLSIGGWGGCKYYSDAALTDTSVKNLLTAVFDKFIKGNLPLEKNSGGKGVAAGIFDGFDLRLGIPGKRWKRGNPL